MSLLNELIKYIENQFQTSVDSAFHYTSEFNYDEIARCGYIKLNSHHFLNQKNTKNREIECAYNLIIKKFSESTNLKHLIPQFERYVSLATVFYTASFSTIMSSNLAKEYGEYCFEIDSIFFTRAKEKDENLWFAIVEYDQEKQNNIISTLFDIHNNYKNKSQYDYKDLIHVLTIILPLFKYPTEPLEYECRLIRLEGFEPDGKLYQKIAPKKIILDIENDIKNVYRM